MSYQFKKGERVVVLGMYLKDSKPIGVVGTVSKPNSRKNPRIHVLVYDGDSWASCIAFDKVTKERHFICRPLFSEEREKLDNALNPFILAKPLSPWHRSK